MRIIIYEKDESLVEFISRVSKSYVTDLGNHIYITLSTLDSTKIVREAMRFKINNCEPTIYLLGTSVKRFNDGIEMAKAIREIDPLGYIVFVSDSVESRKFIDYKIKAYDYFLKPLGMTEFVKLLNKVDDDFRYMTNSLMRTMTKNIVVSSGYKDIVLPLNDIIAFEHRKPRTVIYTKQGDTKGYYTLKEIEEKIDKVMPYDESTFIKTHKSYIVNMQHIESVNVKDLVIKTINGRIYPISRLRKKEVKEKLEAFRGMEQ